MNTSHGPRLSLKAIVLLTLPPLLWSGNAVVGRMVAPLISPMTLNVLRWALALLILLPLAPWVLRRGSPLWAQWRRFAVLGCLSIASYNALLYLALTTSSPMNVTLVGASTPVWMLLIGRFFFGTPVSARQLLGAVLSIAGVVLVMCRGQWDILIGFHLVAGDVYMLIAAIGWAFYSWMLAHPTTESAPIRADWAAFLLAQTVFGLVGALGCASLEWTLTDARLELGWPLAAALAFIGLGPAVLSYRAWGAGVALVGPSVAGFFMNLIPLFAALLSTIFLGESPQLFHAAAFMLIAAGIVLSARKTTAAKPEA
jgi:drug/metabolite transporter (DMT)-like permease